MNWRDTGIAPAGTHHVRDGAALYFDRFDEVLEFREPGLDPVRRDGEAWHIRVDGSAAYGRRFRRTFGYYEGRSAVAATDGWHHIREDGTDLYEARYQWCGNFQGGRCAVREFGGGYLHLTPEGRPAYATRWSYAGDFRNGAAVVQGSDGRSTHVDPRGTPMHGVWFVDLDVFHKGSARARDDDGWTHVDATGRPLYARRFAAVEPFYNGQARVERFDGGLEVIDEAGGCIAILRPALKSAFAALSDDLTGFWRTQAICAAVELGVFEALPGSAGELARRCGLDAGRVPRLLRALAELRLVAEADGAWRATGGGAYLTTAHPLTLAGAAVEYGRYFRRLWEALPQALRGTNWRPPDIFAEVAADPSRTAPHHRMLMSYARHDYGPVPAALDLRGDEHVIDAGGGLGVLAHLLVETYPGVRMTVLDRPEVVGEAMAWHPGNRIRFHAADLFERWSVQGDAVVIARVLHDWDDAPALRLLHRARSALPAGGRLYVVEMALSERGAAGGLCDLHLLVANGGRERTAAEYVALLGQAGFHVASDGVRRLPRLPSVVVGVAG